ncbi:hypothetical protein BJV82DRAFT_589647 [Fennellomyces sp. T-0311]|nr:hypothetical protein BJV82DRAFT_589647 [Fennellomyces sp. T-0311]
MSLPSPPLANHKAPAPTMTTTVLDNHNRRLVPFNTYQPPQKLAPWPQPDHRVSQQQQIESQRAAATRKRVFQDMDQIVSHCSTMRETMIHQQSIIAPDAHLLANSQPWLDDMVTKANEILNALLRMQKQQLAAQEEKRQAYYYTSAPPNNIYADQRSDLHDDEEAMQYDDNNPLRSLRQRKRRKRTVFQGRCHSCNISETPEWRRGPDGARTLCNACGLHYAKLERKRAAAEANKEKEKPNEPLMSPSSSPTSTLSSSLQDDVVVTP